MVFSFFYFFSFIENENENIAPFRPNIHLGPSISRDDDETCARDGLLFSSLTTAFVLLGSLYEADLSAVNLSGAR